MRLGQRTITQLQTPIRLSVLRHEALLKGVSIVIILSLMVAVVLPASLPFCLCVALGAGSSYVASVWLFQL